MNATADHQADATRRLARRSARLVRREGPLAAPRGPHPRRRLRRLHPPLRPQPARRAHPRHHRRSSRFTPARLRRGVDPHARRRRDRRGARRRCCRLTACRPRPRPARVGAAALGCRPCDGARTGRAGSWSWRSSPLASLTAGRQLERHAAGRPPRRQGCVRTKHKAKVVGAALRAPHRDRRDGLVLLARARRPQRRRQARDRRARSTRPSSSTPTATCSARARRPRAASTRRASSPTSTATRCPRSSSAATRGPSRRTTWSAAGCSSSPGWPASTCSGGQCPEARGMAAADLDGDGKRRGRRDDDEHLADRIAGLRLRRRGQRRTSRRARPRPAWPRYNTLPGPGQRRRLQRRRQPRLRRLRRERRHRQPRRRPAARDRRHLRQPPDQRLQPRRHVGARLAVVHQPPERPPRRAAGLGAVHPLAEPDGRGQPATTATSARGPTCARRAGCSGRPRRRRSPTSTATGTTRSSGCRTRR